MTKLGKARGPESPVFEDTVSRNKQGRVHQQGWISQTRWVKGAGHKKMCAMILFYVNLKEKIKT